METDYLLKAGRSRALSDDHVWWSIFTRPIRSRFNRKQRVSAAFAMLYLMFLTSAMYYGMSSEHITDAMFKMAFLPMDATDIIIGLISNMIVFPPVILIVLLFKKAKPIKRRTNRADLGLEIAQEKGRFNCPEGCGQIREETEFDSQ